MNPTCSDQYQYRTYDRCNDNRPELCLDNIEVKHQRHAGRNEEKSQISNQKIGQALYPFQLDPT